MIKGPLLSYIQKEMHRLHTETTRSSDYLLKTVLSILLYMHRPDAARVAGYVTTRSRSVRRGRLGGRCNHCCNTLLSIIHSKGDAQTAHGDYA